LKREDTKNISKKGEMKMAEEKSENKGVFLGISDVITTDAETYIKSKGWDIKNIRFVGVTVEFQLPANFDSVPERVQATLNATIYDLKTLVPAGTVKIVDYRPTDSISGWGTALILKSS
jgi:hypothetical protein